MGRLSFIGKMHNDEVWNFVGKLRIYSDGQWLDQSLQVIDDDFDQELLTEERAEALAKMPKRVEIGGYVEEFFYGEEFDCEVRFAEITEKKIIQELSVFQELFVPRTVRIIIEEVQE